MSDSLPAYVFPEVRPYIVSLEWAHRDTTLAPRDDQRRTLVVFAYNARDAMDVTPRTQRERGWHAVRCDPPMSDAERMLVLRELARRTEPPPPLEEPAL